MQERDELELALGAHASAMQGIPDDARRMGLDRNTEEGALVAMAGSLDRRKTTHRVVAWVAVAALAAPIVLSVLVLVL